MHEHKLQVIAEPNAPSMVLRYVVAAPRTLVFDAFTQSELLQRWAGPDDHQKTKCRSDARVGGTWELTHVDKEGHQENLHGVYTFLRPPERLIRTVISEQDCSDEALETVSFEETLGETTIVTSAAYRSIDARNAHLADTAKKELAAEYRKLEGLLDVLKAVDD